MSLREKSDTVITRKQGEIDVQIVAEKPPTAHPKVFRRFPFKVGINGTSQGVVEFRHRLDIPLSRSRVEELKIRPVKMLCNN